MLNTCIPRAILSKNIFFFFFFDLKLLDLLFTFSIFNFWQILNMSLNEKGRYIPDPQQKHHDKIVLSRLKLDFNFKVFLIIFSVVKLSVICMPSSLNFIFVCLVCWNADFDTFFSNRTRINRRGRMVGRKSGCSHRFCGLKKICVCSWEYLYVLCC